MLAEYVTLSAGTKQVRWQLVGIVHETNDVAGSSNPAGQVGDAFTTLSTLNLSLRDVPADASSRWYVQVHDHSHAALQQTVDAILQRVSSLNGEDVSVELLH